MFGAALFFWFTFPLSSWAFKNNVLEVTATVMVLSAVLCFVKAVTNECRRKYFIWAVLYGIFLVAGLMTKGPTPMFPLAAPFIYGALYPKKWRQSCGILAVAMVMLAIFGAMVYAYPPAKKYFTIYFNSQILGSLAGKRETVGDGILNRLSSWFRLLQEGLPSLIIVAILHGATAKHKVKSDLKLVWFFLLIGMSGSLPMVISPKQSGFYMVPAFPFFAIAAAVYCAPRIELCVQRFLLQTQWILRLNVSLLICLFILFLSLPFWSGRIFREQEIQKDLKLMASFLKPGSIISLVATLEYDFPLIAYLQRYYQVSIGKSESQIIADKQVTLDANKWMQLTYNTERYVLYQRKE